jgi:hypothetical protein
VVQPSIDSEIAAQLDVDMHSQVRWIADPDKYVQTGAGIFGDGLVHWMPSQGSLFTGLAGEPRWKFDPASQGVIDAEYSWKTARHKTKSFPALLMRNSAWGKLYNFPDKLPGYTAIFVMRIRRTTGGPQANIFASRTDPLELDGSTESRTAFHSHQGHVRTYRGHKHHFISSRMGHTQRPVIIAVREDTHKITHIVGAHHGWHRKHFHHDRVKHFDMTWFLNREAGVFSRRRTLIADIVDVVMWDHARSDEHFHQDVRKLNRLYGAVAR